MTAVVEELTTAVFVAREALGGHQLVVGLTCARHLADHLGPPDDLDAAQLAEVMSVIDHHAHPRISLDVGEALALDDRGHPQRVAIPHEPDGTQVRSCRIDGGQPTGALLEEELVPFLGGHGHAARPPLFPDHDRSWHGHIAARTLADSVAEPVAAAGPTCAAPG